MTIQSLDPIVQFADAAPQTVDVPAATDRGPVRCGRRARRARARPDDGWETREKRRLRGRIPVEVLVSPETVSAIGEAGESNPTAAERLKLPAGVVSTFGGLHVDLSSTALVGLGEGARYLVEYPYGCAEQRGSRSLSLMLSADLGEAFKLPGIEPAQLRSTVQSSLRELERFQCDASGDCPAKRRSYRCISPPTRACSVASGPEDNVDRLMPTAPTPTRDRAGAEAANQRGVVAGLHRGQAFAVKVLKQATRILTSTLYGRTDGSSPRLSERCAGREQRSGGSADELAAISNAIRRKRRPRTSRNRRSVL